MTALIPSLAGSTYIYGAGTIDSGMTFSTTAMVLDAEVARNVIRVLQGIEVNPNTLALDVIKKVGPRSNFLAQKHTVKNWRSQQAESELFDRTPGDLWEEQGRKTALDRAREKAIYLAENHKPRPLAPEVLKGIEDILRQAEEEQDCVGWNE